MNISDEIKNFNYYMHEILETHCNHHYSDISEMYSHLEYLNEFKIIYPKMESVVIMDEVHSDLFNSIYLATKGMYRNAYISLRSALELGIGYLYFCDNNLDYLKWTKNKFDLSWSRLNDEKKGILTNEYLSLFYYNGVVESNMLQLITKCKDTYRICSEYTHGKYGFMRTSLSSKYDYNKDDFLNFVKYYKDTIFSIFCLHAIRFNANLVHLPGESFDEIESILKNFDLMEIVNYE